MASLLAIQLKRIGDLILTLPTLEALRTANPSAEISLIIDGDSAGMAPAIRCVDRVLIYQKNSLNFEIYWRLLFGRFDAALDFTGTDRSSLLTSLSRAKRRITFQWAAKTQLRSTSYTDFVDSPVRDKHTIDHYMDLLSALELPPGNPDLQMELPANAYVHAREILRNRSVTSPYIVIHTGAARAEKYWRSERWATVIDYCQQDLKMTCVLIGGHSSMEKEAIKEIRQRAGQNFIDVSGQLDLMESAALIDEAALFVGIDSGPSHLASALRTPQVTLFGPTNPFHWRARHPHSLVLQGGKENPLTQFDGRAPTSEMNHLSTEEVIHAINLLLPDSLTHDPKSDQES